MAANKIKYGIHHQAVFDCPDCGEIIVEDLGEDDMGDGIQGICPQCRAEYELSDD